jgi:hypothetical protein
MGMINANGILTELGKEFDRQVENLLRNEYPKLAGLTEAAFVRQAEPLRGRLGELAVPEGQSEEGRVPFVIVIKRGLVAEEEALSLVERKGKRGFTSMQADDIKGFVPVEEVTIPDAMAYLVVDIDTGKDTLNVTPEDAFEIIKRENRSPLTLDEGIALLTHYPEVLRKNNCFYMLGSRCGDRRITALWLSSGKPRLGWCWAGNPHTWLGSASCRGRVVI